MVIRRILSILALTVSITAIAAIGLNADVFAGFQRRATDSLFPAAPSDPNVVVVGYDGKTIQQYGNPLPRTVVADLTNKLSAAGAKVIAFDAIFRSASTEPGGRRAVQAGDRQRPQRGSRDASPSEIVRW